MIAWWLIRLSHFAYVTAQEQKLLNIRQTPNNYYSKLKGFSCPRPGKSAILLETGSIDHSRALSITSALRVREKDVNIAQYQALSIPSALRVTKKKFPLILVRGSQSCLSWFIVSMLLPACFNGIDAIVHVKCLKLFDCLRWLFQSTAYL